MSQPTSCGPTQMTSRSGLLAHIAQGGSSAEALRERFVLAFLLPSFSETCVQFGHVNSLVAIARAHQFVQEGYKYISDEALATMWSAPNYCYFCGNMAGILTFGKNGARSFAVYWPR
jgi:hypothetical protein